MENLLWNNRKKKKKTVSVGLLLVRVLLGLGLGSGSTLPKNQRIRLLNIVFRSRSINNTPLKKLTISIPTFRSDTNM